MAASRRLGIGELSHARSFPKRAPLFTFRVVSPGTLTGMGKLGLGALLDSDVERVLTDIRNDRRRRDARDLCDVMRRATEEPPYLWGSNIIGFGMVDFTYVRGRSGVWMATGFAARASYLAIYLMDGVSAYAAELDRLGPHTTHKSCLHVRDLREVDLDALSDLVRLSYLSVTRHAAARRA